MASTKYIGGYLGGAAIAAGVGAAIAVAGAASAHAETPDGESNPASTKTETKTERPKPLSQLADRVEKAASDVAKAVSPKKTPSIKLFDPTSVTRTVTVKKPKPTAAEFEAQQVQRLKNLYQPQATQQAAVAVSETAEADDDSANPFRQNDPPPVDIPEPVINIRDAVVKASPTEIKPFAREGVEQAYRITQMVPWVNAVVPVTKIVPSLGTAIGGDETAARDARQLIVNELIKTTPPGSFLYYGYDLLADLTNQEDPAQELKEQAFAGVWDLLDFTDTLHNPGEPGIGNSLGG